METMAMGMFTAMILFVSGSCLYCKKLLWSFFTSIVAVALTCQTGYRWKSMLINSGKDTALLGFNRYPAALIVLVILLLGAFTLLVVSIIGIVRRNKSKG